MTTPPTERFSNRADDYARARPGYPPAAIDLLAASCGLAPGAVVADIGSGTGILTRLLLDRGATVYGVEPNAAMRQAAEATLGDCPAFTSVPATAEATTLPTHSLNLIAAGQAFHWFVLDPTRREWLRILRPGGQVALIWNDRRTAGSAFLEAYEQLLRTYSVDYTAVQHRQVSEARIHAFYGATRVQHAAFPNVQDFDLPGLERRLRSSSYTPASGQPGHDAMLAALADLFARHQVRGRVQIHYDTTVYHGRLTA